MSADFIQNMPLRWIHLDFHTSGMIPDIGAEFDPTEFAQTLKRAHVEVCTLFGVCHHGWSYYPTEVGEMHPHLGFDLLGAQIEACRSVGIRTPVYVTVVWNEHQGRSHPEWLQMSAEGKPYAPGPFETSWHCMCMNSEYMDLVKGQAVEILGRYDPEGIFFDIVWQHPSGCYCPNCVAFAEDEGLDPQRPSDMLEISELVVINAVRRLTDAVRAVKPMASLFYNGRVQMGLAHIVDRMTHIEIEALPTGGWGYSYFPLWVRYARTLGLPTQGMTGRFHKSWADFGGLKEPHALYYDCAGIVANASAISVGDQLHPRGRLDPAVYDVIGEAFGEVAARERWLRGARSVAEIALIVGDTMSDAHRGAAKMLMELHQQFDIVDTQRDLSGYALVIVPDETTAIEDLDQFPEFMGAFGRHLAHGGPMLLTHRALLDPATGDFAPADAMGCSYVGDSPYCPEFFRPGPLLGEGICDFHWAMYDQATEVRITDGEPLGEVWDPYFNRSWQHFTSHQYAPAERRAQRPLGVRKGDVIYLAEPFFGAYWRHGNIVYRRVIANAVRALLPRPLVRASVPPSAEVTVTDCGGARIVHIVNWSPERHGAHVEAIGEPIPLREVTVSLRTSAAPARCLLAPSGDALEIRYDDGYATCTIPEIQMHGMVVFE